MNTKTLFWLSVRLGFSLGVVMAIVELAIGRYIDSRIESYISSHK